MKERTGQMIRKAYKTLDAIGAGMLQFMAVLLGVVGFFMLFIFFPIGLGLILLSLVCAVLGK